MGNDYYIRSEHYVHADGSVDASAEKFGYYVIIRQYYNRYRLPVMHTETNVDDYGHNEETKWRRKEWQNVVRLRQDGVPIIGFTWYSLTDRVDWDCGLRFTADVSTL